jgi:hypothetical protein
MLKQDADISEIQQHLKAIYQVSNKQLPIESILGRILEAVSETNSPFEVSDTHGTFVKTLSWYFAFCNRLEIDVQRAVIYRYPKFCPLCLAEVCVCEGTYRWPRTRARHLAGSRDEELKTRADRILNAYKVPPKKGPPAKFDLNWFSNVLADIFPVNRARWRVNRFYFPAKMLRELGKITNGFRRYRNTHDDSISEAAKAQLEKDAADFFAWVVGYWTLAAHEMRDFDIQEKFVSRYAIGCPYCDRSPCKCPPERRRGNRAEFVAFNLSDESADIAQEFASRVAEYKKELEPFPDLASELEKGVSKSKAEGSKKNVIDALQSISDKAGAIDDLSGKVEKIITRGSALAEWIDRFFG